MRSPPIIVRRSAAALVLLGASVALGQDAPTLGAAPPVPTWKVKFDPAAWYVAPGGKLTLPTTGGGEQVDLENLDLDNPRLSPYAELHLAIGDWRINFSGFSYAASINSSTASTAEQIGDTAFVPGDQLRSNFDFQSFEVTGGYRFFQSPLNPKDGVYSIIAGLDVLAGARVYDTSVDVSLVGGPSTTSTNEFFADPILGIHGELEIYDKFTLDLRSTAGYLPGDQSTWSFDIVTTGVYRPIPNVGIMIGYRQLLFDLESGTGNDRYEFRGGMAGLFAGVELRF